MAVLSPELRKGRIRGTLEKESMMLDHVNYSINNFVIIRTVIIISSSIIYCHLKQFW